jgi:hypothetical protein
MAAVFQMPEKSVFLIKIGKFLIDFSFFLSVFFLDSNYQSKYSGKIGTYFVVFIHLLRTQTLIWSVTKSKNTSFFFSLEFRTINSQPLPNKPRKKNLVLCPFHNFINSQSILLPKNNKISSNRQTNLFKSR